MIKSNERGRKIRSAFNDAVRVMCAKDASISKEFHSDARDAIAVNEKPPAGEADAVNLGFGGVVRGSFTFAQRRSPDLFATSLTPFIRIFGSKCGTFPALH